MKKLILILLCCLLLSGCAGEGNQATEPPVTGTQATTVPETTSPEIPVVIYSPNENADGFETLQAHINEVDPMLITALLEEHSMLNSDITLNSAELVDSQLNLDFNQAFLDQLCSYGTAGERMMIGCVVNTFLSVYDAETVYITVEGQIMESGHVIYDFPLTLME